MDSFIQDDINKLSDEKRQSYEARSQIGDIIVVRPNGWKWGKAECLPNYVVIKLPNISVEEAKKYEESLFDTAELGEDEVPIKLKKRKYQVPLVTVENYKTSNTSVVEITGIQEGTFVNNIIIKTE